jgi:hypothetical protein
MQWKEGEEGLYRAYKKHRTVISTNALALQGRLKDPCNKSVEKANKSGLMLLAMEGNKV